MAGDPTVSPDAVTAEQQAASQQQSAAWLLQNRPDLVSRPNTTAEAAAAANLAYRTDTAPKLPQYANQTSQYTQAEVEDARNEYLKHQREFHPQDYYGINARDLSGMPLAAIASRYGTSLADYTQTSYTYNPSDRFTEISGRYETGHTSIVGAGGVMYVQPATPKNPYPSDSAAGIAWDVGRTGGTDIRLNITAEAERVWYNREYGTNIDSSFIKYATNVYYNRPAFQQEDLTTKTGYHITNQYWAGGPIRMNLSAQEIAAGGGINDANYSRFLTYNTETRALEQVRSPNIIIGLESGVHTEPGDWGGPIYENMYGASAYGSGGAGTPKSPVSPEIPLSIRGDASGEVLSRAGFDVIGGSQSAVTINVPYGGYVQEQIVNTKLGISRETGELAIYKFSERSGTWDLMGGGGRYSLQSGMFTVGKAATPYVVTQEDIGTYVRPSAATTSGLSRLGAEAYGGQVRNLTTTNLLTQNEAISRYFGEGSNNLANLVNQVASGKSEAPGAKIAWSVSPNAPAIQYMNEKGFTGEAVNTKGGVFSEYTVTHVHELAPVALASVGSPAVTPGIENMYDFSSMKEETGRVSLFSATTPDNVRIVRSESWLYGIPLVGGVAEQVDSLISFGKSIGTNPQWVPTLGELQVQYLPTSKTPAMRGFAEVYRETDVITGEPYLAERQKTGGADWSRKFISPEGKSVEAMWVNTGEPTTTVGTPVTTFAYDAEGNTVMTKITPISTSYQREYIDLAHVMVTPTTTRVEKYGESDFMAFQKSVATRIGLPENISMRQFGLDQKNPWIYSATITSDFVQSGYSYVRNNPAGVASFALEMYAGGWLFGKAGKAFQAAEVASTGLPAGSALIPVAKATSFANRYVIPAAFVGMIGTDVVGTTTEWGSDFTPEGMSQRGGAKTVETAIMFGFGGAGYARGAAGMVDLGIPHWAGSTIPKGGGVWEAGGYHPRGWYPGAPTAPTGGGPGGGAGGGAAPVAARQVTSGRDPFFDTARTTDEIFPTGARETTGRIGFDVAEQRMMEIYGTTEPKFYETATRMSAVDTALANNAARLSVGLGGATAAAKTPWYQEVSVGESGNIISESRTRLPSEVEQIILKMSYADYTNWLMQNPEVVVKDANTYALITARGTARLDQIYGTGHRFSSETYRTEGISIEGYDASISALKKLEEPGKVSVLQFGLGDYWTQVSYSGVPNRPGLSSYHGLPYTGKKMYVTFESIAALTPEATAGFATNLQSYGFRGGFKMPTDAVDAFGRFENIVVYERAPEDFGAARTALADAFGEAGYSVSYGKDVGGLSSSQIMAYEVGGILAGKLPAKAKSLPSADWMPFPQLAAGENVARLGSSWFGQEKISTPGVAGLLPAGEELGFALVGKPYTPLERPTYRLALPAPGQTASVWSSPIDIETNINWLKLREQPVLEKYETVRNELKWKPLEFTQAQLNAMQYEHGQTLTTLGEYRELQLTDLFVREDREIGAFFGAEPGIEGVMLGMSIGKPSKAGRLGVSFGAMYPYVRGFVKEYYERDPNKVLFGSSGEPWLSMISGAKIITGTSIHTHPMTWEKGLISEGSQSGGDIMETAKNFQRARRGEIPIKFVREDVGFVGFDKPMLYETSVTEAIMIKAITEHGGEPGSLARSITVSAGRQRKSLSVEIRDLGLKGYGTEWVTGHINLRRRTQVKYGWPTEIKALSETPGVFLIDEAGELKLIKPKVEEGFEKPKYAGDILQMKRSDINTSLQDMEFGISGKHDVREISDAILRGETMPPVTVGKSGYLHDGRHRMLAYERLGIENIDVVFEKPSHTGEISKDYASSISQRDMDVALTPRLGEEAIIKGFHKPDYSGIVLPGREQLPTVRPIPTAPEKYSYLRKSPDIEQFLREGASEDIERFAVIDAATREVITSGYGVSGAVPLSAFEGAFRIGEAKGKVFVHTHGPEPGGSNFDIVGKYPSGADIRLFLQYGAERYEIYSQHGVTTVELPEHMQINVEDPIAHMITRSEEARRIEKKFENSITNRLVNLGYKNWGDVPPEVLEVQYAGVYASMERQTGIKIRISPYESMTDVAGDVIPGAKDLMQGKYGGGEKSFRKPAMRGSIGEGYIPDESRYAALEALFNPPEVPLLGMTKALTVPSRFEFRTFRQSSAKVNARQGTVSLGQEVRMTGDVSTPARTAKMVYEITGLETPITDMPAWSMGGTQAVTARTSNVATLDPYSGEFYENVTKTFELSPKPKEKVAGYEGERFAYGMNIYNIPAFIDTGAVAQPPVPDINAMKMAKFTEKRSAGIVDVAAKRSVGTYGEIERGFILPGEKRVILESRKTRQINKAFEAITESEVPVDVLFKFLEKGEPRPSVIKAAHERASIGNNIIAGTKPLKPQKIVEPRKTSGGASGTSGTMKEVEISLSERTQSITRNIIADITPIHSKKNYVTPESAADAMSLARTAHKVTVAENMDRFNMVPAQKAVTPFWKRSTPVSLGVAMRNAKEVQKENVARNKAMFARIPATSTTPMEPVTIVDTTDMRRYSEAMLAGMRKDSSMRESARLHRELEYYDPVSRVFREVATGAEISATEREINSLLSRVSPRDREVRGYGITSAFEEERRNIISPMRDVVGDIISEQRRRETFITDFSRRNVIADREDVSWDRIIRPIETVLQRNDTIEQQISQQIQDIDTIFDEETVPDIWIDQQWKRKPPTELPKGGIGAGGGSGGGPSWMWRTNKRNYKNPVVDVPYLESLYSRFEIIGQKSGNVKRKSGK